MASVENGSGLSCQLQHLGGDGVACLGGGGVAAHVPGADGAAAQGFLHRPLHQGPQLRLPDALQQQTAGEDGGDGVDDVLPLVLGGGAWLGSNMETPCGLRFAPAAKPRPPVMAAPRSVMMSPMRLGSTTTP